MIGCVLEPKEKRKWIFIKYVKMTIELMNIIGDEKYINDYTERIQIEKS